MAGDLTERTMLVDRVLQPSASVGVALTKSLYDLMKLHLCAAQGLEDIEDYPQGEEWVSVFKDAWKKSHGDDPMPGYQIDRVRKWLGLYSPVPPSQKGGGNGVEPLKLDFETYGEIEASEDEKNAAMMAKMTNLEAKMFKDDMSAQDMPGDRMLRLDVCIEMGAVIPAAEIESGGFKYKQDPKISEMAKARRKAGCRTLSSVLDNKDALEAADFFVGLMNELAEAQMIAESARVSQFWTQTQSYFVGNDKGLFKYLAQFRHRYRGRGLPVVVDTEILLRNGLLGSSPSALAGGRELAQLKEELAKANAAIKKLQVKKPGDEDDKKPGDKKRGPKCWKCGQPGHIARDCTEKVDDEKDE